MLIPFVVAGAVALLAYRARLLTPSGAVAATLVGGASLLAGSRWVVLLLFFFIGSSALSQWRRTERDQLIGSLVEKGSRRDAWQVLANGGAYAAAAILAARTDALVWPALGIGAIAAATADTWSTEIGTVLGGVPRSILTGRPVAPGTSGGITIAGSAAAVLASILAAVIAAVVDWREGIPAIAIVAGGITGSVIDSLLGATVQEQRWCPHCESVTERRRHSCGTSTTHRGGIRGCDNDAINLLSTLAGAVVTWALSVFLGPG